MYAWLYNSEERQRRLVQACAVVKRLCSCPGWPRGGGFILGPLVPYAISKSIYNPRKKVFTKRFSQKDLGLLLEMPNPGVCIAKSNPEGGH